MKPSAAILRKASAVLNRYAELVKDRSPSEAREAETLAARLMPRRAAKKVLPFKTRKEKKLAREEAHNLSTKEIRAACVGRAAGFCEACGWSQSPMLPLTMDHWLNGIGRRRQKQSVENCWMLCGRPGMAGTCHHRRQLLEPSAARWNALFAEHAAKYGYPAAPHVEHAPLGAG